MCIPYEHMPKNLEILNFEQLLKRVLRVFSSLGGVNSVQWGYTTLVLSPSILIICFY